MGSLLLTEIGDHLNQLELVYSRNNNSSRLDWHKRHSSSVELNSATFVTSFCELKSPLKNREHFGTESSLRKSLSNSWRMCADHLECTCHVVYLYRLLTTRTLSFRFLLPCLLFALLQFSSYLGWVGSQHRQWLLRCDCCTSILLRPPSLKSFPRRRVKVIQETLVRLSSSATESVIRHSTRKRSRNGG